MAEQVLDAVDYLTAQHRALEELMNKVLEAERIEERQLLFAQAGDQLTVHIKSEEEIFYPAVRAARPAHIQHQELGVPLDRKPRLSDMGEQ